MGDDEQFELTDEWAMQQWATMAPLIETMVGRRQHPAERVEPSDVVPVWVFGQAAGSRVTR